MKLNIAVIVLFVNIIVSCQTGSYESDKPNVIIILADDMGYSDIGCFGSEISTPNLDKLANEGIRLTQFYNAARCCPTRASLLTGVYPHQAGMGDMVEGRIWNDSTFLPAYQGYLGRNTATIAEILGDNGYYTAISGKWHLGDAFENLPAQRGFRRSFSLIEGASNYFNLKPWINENQHIELLLDGKPYHPDKDFYMTNAITEYGKTFIDEAISNEKPFFLYLAYTAPHWPLQALPEDIKKFEDDYHDGWEENRKQRFQRMKQKGIIPGMTEMSDLHFISEELTPKWSAMSAAEQDTFAKRMAVYAAMVYRMDVGIGEIINQLKEEKEMDNTFIVFLSDNGATRAMIYLATSWYADRSGAIGTENSFEAQGPGWANMSNTPLRLYKQWTHEGGIRTPFIACWPNQLPKRGLDTASYGHIIDLMPTILDVAGVPFNDTLYGINRLKPEGISLLSLLKSAKQPTLRPLFWEHHGNAAVRFRNWKLVRQHNKPWELYLIDIDPGETRNVIEEYPHQANDLLELYNQWSKEVGVEPWDSLKLARDL